MQPTTTTSLLAACCAFAALTGACRNEKVVTYRVAKETPAETRAANQTPAAPAANPATMAEPPRDAAHAGLTQAGGQSAAAAPAAPALTWQVPAQWQSKPSNGVRKGSYTIPGANGEAGDLAVTAFPGDVGGEAANVNRWRGQLGLAPLDDATATAALTRIEVGSLRIAVLDIASSGPSPATRMIGAIVPFEGFTWFFKFVGPDAVLAKEKPAFLAMLKTLQAAPKS